jgi:hypothetical protein
MIPRHLILGVVFMLAVVLGISIYMLRMRSRVVAMPLASVDSRPVAPPTVGSTEEVTLYVADDAAGLLRPLSVRIPLPSGRQQRAEEILRSLVNLYLGKSSSHSLPAGAEVRNVYLLEPGTAVIDTNGAFADNHRSGILVEELTVTSLIQSLASNLGGINRVKILVEGKQRDTLAGHADLADFYDVSAVVHMAEQMQSAQ